MISDSSSGDPVEPDCQQLMLSQSHASDSDGSKDNSPLPEHYGQLEDSSLEEEKKEDKDKEDKNPLSLTANQAQSLSKPQDKSQTQPENKLQDQPQPVQEAKLQASQMPVQPKPAQILKIDMDSKLDRRAFVMAPCPQGFQLGCTISAENSVYEWEMYGCDFKMQAKKKGFPARSFVIDLTEGAYMKKKKAPSPLGKIKFNGKKTEFEIWAKETSGEQLSVGFVEYV